MGQGTEYEIEESYDYDGIHSPDFEELSPHLKIVDMKIAAEIVRNMPVGAERYIDWKEESCRSLS